MSKYQRIFFELLAPPFLATIWLLIASSKSETISEAILGFLPLLAFAYMFGILPAVFYTIALELWFQFGLHARFGLLCTVGLSASLGAIAGYFSGVVGALIGTLIWADCEHLAFIGATVGLLVGLYVSWRQTATA